MKRTLMNWFEDKFQENLKTEQIGKEAFYKTINQVGFDAYSSYSSFLSQRSKSYKKRRPKK
jgi:hypothetical protein